MGNIEVIGKVTLDYNFYSGEDLYSDGPIEEELLKIAEKCDEDELGTIINQKNEWVYLYHFSHVRQNIISWIPMERKAKILEIGSGCGAITGALAQKGEKVDCVELSKKRSLINANRNKHYDGITIKVGNFETIEPYLDDDYDIITLIGVWEYANVYLTSEDAHRKFLKLLKRHLKPMGKIIIAIENKFGLKYWAGCREDHTSMYFEGLEGYTKSDSAITFGKNEMINIFEELEYHSEFYYPYPDYKFPLHIFSDNYLPEPGMLSDNKKNLDNTRMVLFDEERVFDSIIKDKMFPYFSNSFLVILSNNSRDGEEQVIYSKFSNERTEEFRIRTDIIKNTDGQVFVKKYPMHKKAEKHIDKIVNMYTQLKRNTEKLPIKFNVCAKKNNNILFEYISGESLDKILNGLLSKGNDDKARKIIQEIVKLIRNMVNDTFEETQEFRKIFGRCPFEGCPAITGADIDLIFSNIIYYNKKWNIIDYEWSYNFPVPVNYILYRVLYFQAPLEIKKLNLCQDYGIGEEEKKIYEQMEDHFMHFVYKNQVLISDSPIIKPKYVINDSIITNNATKTAIKVYYDCGRGLSENNIDYFFYDDPENININIPIGDDITIVRIDPMECRGIAHLLKVEAQTEREIYIPNFHINGIIPKDNYFVFDTEDPWMLFTELKTETKNLHLEFSINKTSKMLIDEIVGQYEALRNESNVKVYYDRGEGLSENDVISFYYENRENVAIDIPVDNTVAALRIDPMESCGIVQIKEISAKNSEGEYNPDYNINGYLLDEKKFIFDMEDPWISMSHLKDGTNCVHVEMCVDKISKSSADIISKNYKLTKWEKIKQDLKW